ncbi:DgyrCDS12739 [Dimorphilus gyrociliatus]|uniref:DgyrCDS12739 n=1 Tax=Dimorphilus gyrociliatus TaxID=2664684 RepID=A0A7I8W7E9_9ANNE|nr:DgyrCDS12739 [Dimorphilus gyrociliatus]
MSKAVCLIVLFALAAVHCAENSKAKVKRDLNEIGGGYVPFGLRDLEGIGGGFVPYNGKRALDEIGGGYLPSYGKRTAFAVRKLREMAKKHDLVV